MNHKQTNLIKQALTNMLVELEGKYADYKFYAACFWNIADPEDKDTLPAFKMLNKHKDILKANKAKRKQIAQLLKELK
jgi:hypothetical protein